MYNISTQKSTAVHFFLKNVPFVSLLIQQAKYKVFSYLFNDSEMSVWLSRVLRVNQCFLKWEFQVVLTLGLLKYAESAS